MYKRILNISVLILQENKNILKNIIFFVKKAKYILNLKFQNISEQFFMTSKEYY